MSTTSHHAKTRASKTGQLLLAGTVGAITAAGLLTAAPTAQAETNCTVSGPYLRLHQSNNDNLSISANGSTLTRAVAVAPGGEHGTYGNVNGGINGRTVDFTITWDNNQGQAHFTGTVGDDGVAHGTSTGPSVPINLWNPGPWDSDSALTCPAAPAPPAPKPLQGPTFTAKPGLAGVTFHVTDRSGVASQCTYSSEGYTDSFALPANASVDLFVPAIREFRNRTGTISCDNGTSTPTSVNF